MTANGQDGIYAETTRYRPASQWEKLDQIRTHTKTHKNRENLKHNRISRASHTNLARQKSHQAEKTRKRSGSDDEPQCHRNDKSVQLQNATRTRVISCPNDNSPKASISVYVMTANGQDRIYAETTRFRPASQREKLDQIRTHIKTR